MRQAVQSGASMGGGMGAEPGALSWQLKHCLITGISSPIPGQEREREVNSKFTVLLTFRLCFLVVLTKAGTLHSDGWEAEHREALTRKENLFFQGGVTQHSDTTFTSSITSLNPVIRSLHPIRPPSTVQTPDFKDQNCKST